MPTTVVHLARLCYPHVGGVERHLLELTAVLAEREVTNIVITTQYEPQLPLIEQLDTMQIFRIPVLANPPTGLRASLLYKCAVWHAIWKLRTVIQRADVVQIHDVFWWLLPLLPLLNRTRLFITFHGYEGDEAPRLSQILWHKIAAWYTRGNLAVGEFHRKWYGIQPTITTHGAVTVPTEQVTRSEKSSATFKILYIGRLSADSGIAVYLQAVRGLKASGQRVELDVYGGGEEHAQFQKFCSQHDLPVRFKGAVPGAAQFIPKYQAAFVSRYLAILEALAVGVSVIAHYNTDIKHDYLQLAPFADWITIVHTPEEIQAAVESILKNPSKYRQSPAAQDWIRAQTWQQMADNYQELWRA